MLLVQWLSCKNLSNNPIINHFDLSKCLSGGDTKRAWADEAKGKTGLKGKKLNTLSL